MPAEISPSSICACSRVSSRWRSVASTSSISRGSTSR
ncbi:F-box-like domain-containing protein [Sphingopyxis sp. USTB-05]|nr:F-box protein [Sphingopyxis sp. USTB-05]